MQECMASWAHLFADFSWRGCLMIFVAGFNDKYQKTHRPLLQRAEMAHMSCVWYETAM